VSDLAPLTALVNLQSLNMSYCKAVSDLAPLVALVNLQSLNMTVCSKAADLAPLGAGEAAETRTVGRRQGKNCAPSEPSRLRGTSGSLRAVVDPTHTEMVLSSSSVPVIRWR
jgi:hypothetical protein